MFSEAWLLAPSCYVMGTAHIFKYYKNLRRKAKFIWGLKGITFAYWSLVLRLTVVLLHIIVINLTKPALMAPALCYIR